MIVGSCLGHSNHEMIEFSVLGEVRMRIRKGTIPDFWRADFGLRYWLGESLGRQSWKAKGSRKARRSSRNKISKVQEQIVSVCHKMSWHGRRPAWLNRELLLRLGKKRVYLLCKKGQKTWGKYKDVAMICKERIRKTKAQLELNLGTIIKREEKVLLQIH